MVSQEKILEMYLREVYNKSILPDINNNLFFFYYSLLTNNSTYYAA